MADTMQSLVLDLVEWVAKEPRFYRDVLAVWRTSCPRLAVWEEAVNQGYVARVSMNNREPVTRMAALDERVSCERPLMALLKSLQRA